MRHCGCGQVGGYMPRGGVCEGHVAKESSVPSKNSQEACMAGAQQPRGTMVLVEDGAFWQGSDHVEI